MHKQFGREEMLQIAIEEWMDFRYTVHDRWHGEFYLDHCGALLDVEPMGEDYVRGMCPDIEDPTLDATAVATTSGEFEDRKSLPLTVLAEPGTRRPEPASSRRWRTAHDRNGG